MKTLPIELLMTDLKTVSEANEHAHWRARQVRAKEQRGRAYASLLCSLSGYKMLMKRTAKSTRVCLAALPAPKLTIHISRHGPRELDSDNLAGSQKHVRDGIADALGVDDGSDTLDWQYHQVRSPNGVYAVLVRLEARE